MAPRGAARPRPPAPLSPVLQTVLGSLLFAAASVLVKALAADLPVAEIAFFRSLFSIPPLVGAIALRRARAWPRRPGPCLLRGLLGTVAMLLYFHAIATIPLGDAVVLGQTAPVFVALLGPALLGEATHVRTWVACAASLVGVALVARPSLGAAGVGTLAALASGLVGALAHVTIRKAATCREDPDVVALAFPLVACAVLALAAPGFRPIDARSLAALAAVGLASGTGALLVTRAFAQGPLAPASVATHATVAFTWIGGVAGFGERLAWPAAVGAAIVCGAGALAQGAEGRRSFEAASSTVKRTRPFSRDA